MNKRNEGGNYLNIADVRARMINYQTLIINDDINWNGESYDKKNYLNYMSKNLFRFSCPLNSEFSYESKETGKTYYYLQPKNYHQGKKFISFNGNKEIYISNPEFFWSKP